jgi:hypothetical protein
MKEISYNILGAGWMTPSTYRNYIEFFRVFINLEEPIDVITSGINGNLKI